MTAPAPAPDTWTAQLDQLRSRYKHVRPAVLAALNILVSDENITIDDAKARASLHGTRITAASIAAARTLLARMDSRLTPIAPAPTREPKRPRPAEKVVDAEALIRGFMAQVQGQGSAEADRLKDAMRKAIAVLQAAVG